MRKRQMRTLTVLAAAALVLAILLALLSREPESAQTKMLLDRRASELTQLRFTCRDETVSLEKGDDAWRLASDADFPLSQASVQTLLDALFAAESAEEFKPDEGALSTYGFDTPQCRIELCYSDDTRQTLTIGSMNAATGQLYVRLDDASTVSMTGTALLQAFSVSRLELLELPLIPTPETQTRVELENAGGTILLSALAAETGGEDGVWYLQTDAGFVPADEQAAFNLRCLTYDLHWRGCAAYGADEAVYAQCGLDAPRAVYTLTYPEGSFSLTIGSARSDGTCYASCGDGGIYLLDEIAASWLAALSDEGFAAEA